MSFMVLDVDHVILCNLLSKSARVQCQIVSREVSEEGSYRIAKTFHRIPSDVPT
jgi:hypothetical protein